MSPTASQPFDTRPMADALRASTIDAVELARTGRSGMPMGGAKITAALARETGGA